MLKIKIWDIKIAGMNLIFNYPKPFGSSCPVSDNFRDKFRQSTDYSQSKNSSLAPFAHRKQCDIGQCTLLLRFRDVVSRRSDKVARGILG